MMPLRDHGHFVFWLGREIVKITLHRGWANFRPIFVEIESDRALKFGSLNWDVNAASGSLDARRLHMVGTIRNHKFWRNYDRSGCDDPRSFGSTEWCSKVRLICLAYHAAIEGSEELKPSPLASTSYQEVTSWINFIEVSIREPASWQRSFLLEPLLIKPANGCDWCVLVLVVCEMILFIQHKDFISFISFSWLFEKFISLKLKVIKCYFKNISPCSKILRTCGSLNGSKVFLTSKNYKSETLFLKKSTWTFKVWISWILIQTSRLNPRFRTNQYFKLK